MLEKVGVSDWHGQTERERHKEKKRSQIVLHKVDFFLLFCFLHIHPGIRL